MRRLRYFGSAAAIVLSGWMLLSYFGLITTAETLAQGWNIFELPSYPKERMAAYLAAGLVLPFLSAWLMRPQPMEPAEEKPLLKGLWPSYSFRLCLAFVGAFVVALMLAFVGMALMDAGVG